jgi:predicted enzyme related to lactoylglutathione lyase
VLRISSVVVDSRDPEGLADWWQGLLGGELVRYAEPDVVTLRAPGLVLDFVGNGELRRVKNRLHLDLDADDYAAGVQRAIDHGARPATDVYDGPGFTVLRDPEGNEFCVLDPDDRPEPAA